MNTLYPLFRPAGLIVSGCLLVASTIAEAQTPAAPNAAAGGINTVANGIEITFVPGAAPVLAGKSASSGTPPGQAVAASNSLRYVDKHGRSVDPRSIKRTERLQPIGNSAAGGRVIQVIMVDRD